jgi:hypothetical protein
VKTITYEPVWFVLGFQENSPVKGLKSAPVGRPTVERMTEPPELADVAETVKLIQLPAMTVWFPGRVSMGGMSAWTFTMMLFETIPCGEAESVTVTVAV